MTLRIAPSWMPFLDEESNKPYFVQLNGFVKKEYATQIVYPNPKNIFRAFDLCPLDQVKVVIVGQDPYHGEGQANGLCFAVHENIPLPPSLKNIFKEISSDMGYDPDKQSGDLSRWARQGVLLLNATLTVRKDQAGSHQKKGWEEFTTAAIDAVARQNKHVVFILWGNYARTKGARIDRSKHFVIESAHPSPLSAHNGFFGSKPFSKANIYLESHGLSPIDWK